MAVVQEDMEDESETKQNLLYVLLLKEYITYFEMLLIDKGIFIRQLFMHTVYGQNFWKMVNKTK